MTTQQTVLSPLQGALARPTRSFRSWATGLTVVGLVGISLVSILYLSLASSNAALSYRLQTMADEIGQLQRVRAERLRELSQLTDPARLDAMARARGFREPSSTLYVNWSAPAPQPVTERAPPTTGPTTPATATDWWEVLTNHLLAWIAEPPPSPGP